MKFTNDPSGRIPISLDNAIILNNKKNKPVKNLI